MKSDDDALLNVKSLAALLGVHPVTLRSRVNSGKVPKPLRLSAHGTRWRMGEIRAWIAAGCPMREKWEMLRN